MLDLSAQETYRSPYESLTSAGVSKPYQSHYNVLNPEVGSRRAESEFINNDVCSGLAEGEEDDATMDELSMMDNQYKAIPCSFGSTSGSEQTRVGDRTCRDPEVQELPLDLCAGQ